MHHAQIPLLALAALAATASQVEATPAAVIATRNGQIEVIERGVARPLATCQVIEAHYIIPDRRVQRTEAPCTFWGLIVHRPTGRWAASMLLTSAEYHWYEDLRVGGKLVALPPATQRRKGAPGVVNRSGYVLVTGDLQGLRAASVGDPATWAEVGEVISYQTPLAFADADTIVLANKRKKKTWNARLGFDLVGPPRALGAMDYTGNVPTALAAGDARYVTTGKRAQLHAPGARPRTLPIRASGRPAVVGNTVVYYRPGTWEDGHCYPENTGGIRSFDLATGADTAVYSQPYMCGYLHDPFTVNPGRGAVMFRAGDGNGGRVMREFTPATGALRTLDHLWAGRILDVSADGRYLLVQSTGAHLNVYDLDTQTHVITLEQGANQYGAFLAR